MKNILSSIVILILTINQVIAQKNPIHKISFSFLVDESLLAIDSQTETDEVKKELAMAAAFALMLTADDKPLAEVWVNKDYIRATNGLLMEHYEIVNKKNDIRTVVYPSSETYTITDSESDPNFTHDYEIEFIAGEERIIAGYKCKLAKIELGEDSNQKYEISIWYTEAIPTIYWGEYAYLKKIPGAALEISTLGLGIVADSVNITNDESVFVIPENYQQVDDITASMLENIENSGDNLEYEIADNYLAYYDEELLLYGIKDFDGNIIIEPRYSIIQPFHNDISIVTDGNNKTGAINISGQVIVPFEYDNLTYSTTNNQFLFSKNGKFGIMDEKCNIIIPNQYDELSILEKGYAIFLKQDKYGILDSNNNIVVEPTFDYIAEHTDSYFIAIDNESDDYVLYTIENKKPIATYKYIVYAQADDLFLVVKDNKYGFINGMGQVVIPIKYSYAHPFVDGKAQVSLEGLEESFFINVKGEEIK